MFKNVTKPVYNGLRNFSTSNQNFYVIISSVSSVSKMGIH